MLISSISEIISIFLFIPLISLFTSNESLENIIIFPNFDKYLGEYNFVFITILIFTISLFIRLFTLFWQNQFAANATNEIVYKAYNALLNEDYKSHIKHKRTDLIATIHGNGNKLFMEVFRPITLIAESYTFILLICLALLIYNWKLFISLFFLLAIIYKFLVIGINKKLKINGKRAVQLNEKLLSRIDVDLNSIEYIQLGNYQQKSSINYSRFDREYKQIYSNYLTISRLPKILIEYIFLTGVVILITFLFFQNSLNQAIPLFASAALLAFKLLPYLQRVFENWSQIVNYKDTALTVLNYAQKYKIKKKESSKSFQILSFKELKFQKVYFSYDDGSKVKILKNINFSIEKGEKIAIMGPSGSGKTTILRLLCGLIPPSSGKVLINSKEINKKINFDTKINWMRSIGYVPQKINLTGSTLRENIIFEGLLNSNNSITVDEVIKITLLEDLVKRCNGLDNNILHNSFTLSGGENQRLAIARAIYRNPKLLIMDEPTSSLDIRTQKKLFDNLLKLRDLTCIVITHRVETKYFFNKILEIKDSSLLEYK